MEKKIPIVLSWSGGKDAAYTLFKLQQEAIYEVKYLLAVFDEDAHVVMHGIPASLIEAQAALTGIPLIKVTVTSTPGDYEERMTETLQEVKDAGIEIVAFGDIHLEDVRQYREQQLRQMNMHALFPLWHIDTDDYLRDFFEKGFRSVVCCVNTSLLSGEFCGKIVSKTLLATFPKTADPFGENGEYHSFCFDGPVFSNAIHYQVRGLYEITISAPDATINNIIFKILKLR